ncbi:hypothetical protein [Pseudomonas extremorientalis]|uniref:Uncharacterized protein n=1 Tax=Pseudomonas extremorientalis TaxID=169669 RepID=A0A1H0KX04_9PSED|nr:hypothetical protein [Pseudomonas extremorientalis]KAB0517531.1 hypothetical protein F7R08_18080 [Pseudomonas extremorientalis]OIN05041.1 hypothetical protein BFN10_24340 [Pseudomonas extremorientalis]SDO60459.1 hypothetical protein SAMN04490184_0967 [Pseudomonas extremorientalis]
MFKVDMSLDAFPVSAGMRELEKKHIPFVMARTATLLAQRVKKGTITVMQKRLDRPTPTTLNSLFVKMATKARAAEVYFKDSWASGIPADTYLQQSVSGGLRPHKRFEKSLIARGIMRGGQYAVPTTAFMNQYGNVSRGTMLKILSGLGAAESTRGYQANANGSAKSRRKGNAHRFFSGDVDGTQGVWERKSMGMGDAVRPVFIFADSAPRYRTIFPFFKIGQNIVNANYQADAATAWAEAMASAR